MKVVVKKSALEQIVKQLAEERGYHSRRIDQIAGDEHPVLPDAQMATQLSTQRVPVEDPDFLPVNKLQLSKAASEIAQEVSPGKIQGFYAGLKKLLRKSSEPKQYKGMSETDLMEALRPFVLSEADEDVPDDEKELAGGERDPNEEAAQEIIRWYGTLPRSRRTSFTMKPSGEKGWKTSDFEIPASRIPVGDPVITATSLLRQKEVQDILKKETGAVKGEVIKKLAKFFEETLSPKDSVTPEGLATLDATRTVDMIFKKADGDKDVFVSLVNEKRANLKKAGKNKEAAEIGIIAAAYLKRFEIQASPEVSQPEESDEEAERARRAETLQKQLGDTLASDLDLAPRSSYQLVGRYATGRPSILDPDSESITGEEGQIESDDLLDQKAEELAELFFDEIISPVFSFVVKTTAGDDEEQVTKKSMRNILDYYGASSYDDFVSSVNSLGMMEDWVRLVYSSCVAIAEGEVEEFRGKIPNMQLVFKLADKNLGLLKVLEKKNPKIFKMLKASDINQISRVRYLTEESFEQIRSVLEIVRRATIFHELLKISNVANQQKWDDGKLARVMASRLRSQELENVIREKIDVFMDSMKDIFVQISDPFFNENEEEILAGLNSLSSSNKTVAKKTIKFVNSYIEADTEKTEKKPGKKV